jgi:hypothetical protein
MSEELDCDVLVKINRIIGPTGRVVLRAVGKKQKAELGDYYLYDYRQDQNLMGSTRIDLRKFHAELLALGPPVTLEEFARKEGWGIGDLNDVLKEAD